jgi:hypothetical protein
MTNRFQTALLSQSACNPSGLCHSLIKMQAEVIAEGGGTDAVRSDPACRLLAYQIGYLFEVQDLHSNEYADVYKVCEQRAEGVQA